VHARSTDSGVTDPTREPRARTILLVEDDSAVRAFIAAVLRLSGYTVLSAETVAHARAFAEAHAGTIDLLVADLLLPDGTARDVAADVPGARVLIVSGWPEASSRSLPSGAQFLGKPFDAKQLRVAVLTALASPSTEPV